MIDMDMLRTANLRVVEMGAAADSGQHGRMLLASMALPAALEDIAASPEVSEADLEKVGRLGVRIALASVRAIERVEEQFASERAEAHREAESLRAEVEALRAQFGL